MPYPSTYAESDLAKFMFEDELGGVAGMAGECGATVASDMLEVVYRVLRDYPVADIDDVTDLDKLRALASWRAWDWAARQLTTRFRVVADKEVLDLQLLYRQAVEMRDLKRQEAGDLGYLVIGAENAPQFGEITAKAPVDAPAPGDVYPYTYPDANDPAYSGSPYVARKRWQP